MTPASYGLQQPWPCHVMAYRISIFCSAVLGLRDFGRHRGSSCNSAFSDSQNQLSGWITGQNRLSLKLQIHRGHLHIPDRPLPIQAKQLPA